MAEIFTAGFGSAAKTMLFAARIYAQQEGPYAAVLQYGANGIDACKTLMGLYPDKKYQPMVWVEVYPEYMVFTDNGIGVVPKVLEKDLQLYLALPNHIGDLAEFRKRLHPASRYSAQYWHTMFGVSGKVDGIEGIDGVRAVGSLSPYGIATRIEIRSRPVRQHAELYYARRGRGYPTTVIRMPTYESLAKNDTRFEIDIDDEPVYDPFGVPMEHGTRIVISGFHEDISINNAQLRRHFNQTFGEESDRFPIELGTGKDPRVIPEFKRAEKVQYPGIPLSSREYELPSGGKISTRFSYDRNNESASPVVLRLGSTKFRLTEIPRFNRYPFNKMNGPLDGPIIAGEDLVWDSPKTGLLPSKARDEWEDLLEFVVGPDRAEEIEEIEEKLGRKDSDLLARDLQEALARAMSESELFAGASFPGLERPSRPRGPNKPEKVINPYVIARVVSEHGTPVEGVRINLLGDDVESSNITGLSGAVQFGRQDPGYYELWMEVPEGMLAWDDIDVYEFEIIERDNPKADFTFKLITNRERDVNSRTSKLNLTVAELPDSGIAYELGTGRGNVIVINSGYDELLRAKDDAAKNAVRAMQASSAVVELCLRGTPSFLMQELNHLFPKVHEAFRDLRKTRKQKESAKKSRRSR